MADLKITQAKSSAGGLPVEDVAPAALLRAAKEGVAN